METSLRDLLNQFDSSYRAIKDSKQQIAFCREQLAKIPSGPDAGCLDHSLYAHLSLRLADAIDYSCLSNGAEEVYALALQRAELSNDDHTCYWTLFCYGMYLCRGFSTDGTPWIQKALKYARTPHEISIILTKLAEIYAAEESTYPQALFLYDWACQIDEAPLYIQFDKYRCLIRHDFKEEVRVVASRRPGETCEEIGPVLAAQMALGRKKAAQKTAEKGLEVAKKAASKAWQARFQSIVIIT